MSDTPETDDQPTINAINENGYQVPCVDIEYARKLERERNEAIHGSCVNYNFTQDARRERDEARADLEFRRGLYKVQEQYLETARRERDEAREKLEEEMKWHHRTHQELVEAQCKLLDMEYDKLKS